MPRNEPTGRLQMLPYPSFTFAAPIVLSPGQVMAGLKISRAKLYELINAGELESYTDGRMRRITVASVESYVKRRLEAEKTAPRRRYGQARAKTSGQSRA